MYRHTAAHTKTLLLSVLLIAGSTAAADGAGAGTGERHETRCDSSQLVLVRSRFWGTLERDSERVSSRELPVLYAFAGHPDLARRHRRLSAVKWGGYLGCLGAMTVLIFAADLHFGIELGVGLSGLIPYSIGSVGQKKARQEFNRRLCEDD
jgi:hypothetical protein